MMAPSGLFSSMLVGSLSLACVSANVTEIVDSGRFERWSHFKDYGVPGTVNDPVNKAAIADGACRMLEQRDGFFMWRDASRTQRVINALAAAPKADQPSRFVLETSKSLRQACFGDDSEKPAERPDYDVKVMASSMQNWYHALCAPEQDPSWSGAFDPAYQPQQMALTTGFMCIAACDAMGAKSMAPSVLARFSNQPGASQRARDQVCTTFPWGAGTDFSQAEHLEQLSHISQPLQDALCQCSRAKLESTGGDSVAAFDDSGRFERWSHFKDYGVPGTVNDPVNKAAIADGACRMLEQRDGFFMWRDGSRTQRVIDALAAAPQTNQPSRFVMETAKSIRQACFDDSGEPAERPDYDVKVMASSMQNWYHALCAPEQDPSWAGAFDPAYQPQQMALTTGFMCIAACDAMGDEATSQGSMTRLSDSEGAARVARDQVCNLFAWGTGIDFSSASEMQQLAHLAQPLTDSLCPCEHRSSVIV